MLNDASYFTTNLINNLVVYLAIHLFVIIILFIFNLNNIIKQFNKIKLKVWVILFLIILLALHLRLASGIAFQSSNETEWEYSSIAKHITKQSSLPYLTHLYGYPFLLSIFFRMFGANIFSVFYFNVAVSILSIILIFLLAYLLFKKNSIALFSAFILAILPRHIYFSRLGASENISIFFILLTLVTLVISIRANKIRTYCFAFALLAYCGEIKAENLALVVLFFIYIFLNKKKVHFGKLSAGVLLFLVLSIPVSYWYVKHDDLKFIINKMTRTEIFTFGENSQYSDLAKISSRVINIKKFVNTFFYSEYHNIILIFALFFSTIGIIKYTKQFIFLITFVFINIIIYLNTILPLIDRYIVLLYPTLAILMGLGLNLMINKINTLFNINRYKALTLTTLIVVLLLTTFSFKELLNPRIKFYKSDYSDINDILKAEKRLDKDAAIVCCGYMKHCDFIMPNQKVLTIDYDIDEIISEKENHRKMYYIKSTEERASGCKSDMLEQFYSMFKLDYLPLSNNLIYINIFEVN